MILTSKLVGYLGRVFNKDPAPQLALLLGYGGAMSWTVADGFLTTSVSGGLGVNLSVDLSQYTVTSLAAYLAAQTGYVVPFVDTGSIGPLSALSLLDGTNSPSNSNGDHLYSYTSVLWAWLDAWAARLQEAMNQIGQMLLQMSTGTASGEWLDQLGSYYNVPRLSGEVDALYGPRIISSVGKPLGNNVAMEIAINVQTGGLVAHVVDVTTPRTFTAGSGGSSYGLFNVVYSIALDGSDPISANTARVSAIVESYRDAGTHIGSIVVNGVLADVYATATIAETMGTMNVGMAPIVESAALYFVRYDATYRYDGSVVATGVPGVITYNNSGETLLLTRRVSGVLQAQEQI